MGSPRSTLEVRNRDGGTLLGHRVEVADTFWSRLRGLLGRRGLNDGEGLLIVPCKGVHMFGMRFPLDVLILDDDREVVATYSELSPWAMSGVHRDGRYALELPAGTIAETGTSEGDTLTW